MADTHRKLEITELAAWHASLHSCLEASRDAEASTPQPSSVQDATAGAIGAIERLIEAIPAATTRDAVVQLMLASAYCEAAQITEGSPHTSLMQRLQRLLQGAIETIAKHQCIELSQLGAQVLLPGPRRPPPTTQ